jgi:Ion channel
LISWAGAIRAWGIALKSDETAYADGRPDGPAAPTARFGLLLLVLIVTYVLSAFSTGRWVEIVQVLLLTGVARLALRNSLHSQRMARLILIATVAVTAVMLALSAATEAGTGIADIWIGLVPAFSIIAIVRNVLSFSTVTLQSIYAAISAYLSIGLMFAAFFAAIDHLGGGHFFADGESATTQTLQYFSFVTLTTLGYGDFTAAGSGGRAVAVLEALMGQIFLATLVARLVAAYRGPADRQR